MKMIYRGVRYETIKGKCEHCAFQFDCDKTVGFFKTQSQECPIESYEELILIKSQDQTNIGKDGIERGKEGGQ